MSDRVLKMIDEIQSIQNMASVQALASAPLARPLPSTKGHSMFGKTSELQAAIAQIRAIEATNPSVAKFKSPTIPTGALCSKTHLEAAKRHLAFLQSAKPGATVRKSIAAAAKPATAKASTSPAKASTGRSAQDLLALEPQAQNRLILAAMPLAAKPLRDELRAAFKSAPAALRIRFASTFRNALQAHEKDLAPSIAKAVFDSLTNQEKMDSIRAGIRIS